MKAEFVVIGLHGADFVKAADAVDAVRRARLPGHARDVLGVIAAADYFRPRENPSRAAFIAIVGGGKG